MAILKAGSAGEAIQAAVDIRAVVIPAAAGSRAVAFLEASDSLEGGAAAVIRVGPEAAVRELEASR